MSSVVAADMWPSMAEKDFTSMPWTRYMRQLCPKDCAQSILQIFSLMIAADRLADSDGFVLFLRKNFLNLISR